MIVPQAFFRLMRLGGSADDDQGDESFLADVCGMEKDFSRNSTGLLTGEEK